MLQSLIASSKVGFNDVINILTEEQEYNISPIENDDYEDGIYIQINGKETFLFEEDGRWFVEAGR